MLPLEAGSQSSEERPGAGIQASEEESLSSEEGPVEGPAGSLGRRLLLVHTPLWAQEEVGPAGTGGITDSVPWLL